MPTPVGIVPQLNQLACHLFAGLVPAISLVILIGHFLQPLEAKLCESLLNGAVLASHEPDKPVAFRIKAVNEIGNIFFELKSIFCHKNNWFTRASTTLAWVPAQDSNLCTTIPELGPINRAIR